MSICDQRLRVPLVIMVVIFCNLVAVSQTTKPILLLFHGVDENRDSMSELAQASFDTNVFAKVIVIGYNWHQSKISEDAPRIFSSVSYRFPDKNFVLLGSKEGGLLAEWIARRVKAADGRILRVITINCPLDGVGKSTPILPELQANSETIRVLSSPPVNNLDSTEFIRLWEKDSTLVAQSSALRVLDNYETTSRLVVRTRPYDSREAIPLMFEEVKKAFADKRYDRVIEVSNEILKIDPGNEESIVFVGPSYYNLATAETNTIKAASMFSESYKYFTRLINSGGELYFPVAHHHAQFLDQNVCFGILTISRSGVRFRSDNERERGFEVAIAGIREAKFEPQKAGRIHLSVRVPRGKKEAKESYNFHYSGIGLERQTVWLTPTAPVSHNVIMCPVGCQPAMEVVFMLLKQLMQP